MDNALVLKLATGGAVAYLVLKSQRHYENPECAELSKYRLGLLTFSVIWPLTFSLVFPDLYKSKSFPSFACGCILPSLYIAKISTITKKQSVMDTFSKNFTKDICINTAVMLLNTLSVDKSGSNSLKHSVSLALIATLFDLDDHDGFLGGFADGMFAASLCTSVSVTLLYG